WDLNDYDFESDDPPEIVADWYVASPSMDISCFEGVLYIMPIWGEYLYRYNRDGESIGQLDIDLDGSNANGVAIETDNNLIFVGSNSNYNLYVFDLEGNRIANVGDLRSLINNQRWTAINWVSDHRDGQLWVNTAGAAWQVAVDNDNWEFIGNEAVQTFNTHSTTQYDGIAHDGRNLWVASNTNANINIYDDGNLETWLYYEPEEGSVAGGNSLDIQLTIDARGFIRGTYEADMIVLSNDPNESEKALNVRLFVTEPPSMVVEWYIDYGFPDEVNWNGAYTELYNDYSYEMKLTLTNYSDQLIEVEAIDFEGDDAGYFRVDNDEFNIEPSEEFDLNVTLEAGSSGEHAVTMTIYSNAEDLAEYEVELLGSTLRAPDISINPDAIGDDLSTGELKTHNLNITNNGESLLTFTINPYSISEPDRDANQRVLRHTGVAKLASQDQSTAELVHSGLVDNAPNRDDQGEIVDQFSFNRIGAGSYKNGIAWDWDNNWMWLASYTEQGIGAVDPRDNYSEVVWQDLGGNRPMGVGWHNGVLYVDYWSNSYLTNLDEDFNEIGTIQLPGRITAIDCADDFIIAITDDDWDIEIVDYNGEDIATIPSAEWRGLIGNETPRSLCWVDEHNEGKLWLTANEHIWQLDINTDNWEVNGLISDFDWSNGDNDWDGLGHDGENLWIGANNQSDYFIVDDGIVEMFWLRTDITAGEIEGDGSLDVSVILNAVRLVGGDYVGELHIRSNDPDDATAIVNVTMTVDDAADIDVSWDEEWGYPDIIDWDQAFPGIYTNQTYQIEITALSTGVVELDVDETFINDDVFTADVDDFSLEPHEYQTIIIAFAPESAGEYNTTMTFISNSVVHPELEIAMHATVVDAPEIRVDPLQIDASLMLGDSEESTITVQNTGDALLIFETEIEVTVEPDRDDAARSLRSIGRNTPNRDELGDEIANVIWEGVGSSNYKGGIAYDWDNKWMWLTTYTDDLMAAFSFDSDYNNFTEEISWGESNPMAAAWLDGVLYNVSWGSQVLSSWDSEGNSLGTVNTGVATPTALASSPDNELLFVMQGNSDFNIHVMTADGENVNEIGNINWRQGALQSADSRSICWVDKHPEGQLWIQADGDVYQVAVDQDWNVTDIVQEFNWIGETPWDGIGHDGHNLWLGAYNQDHYKIVDDNNSEAYWCVLNPRDGEVQSGNNNSMDLTLTLITSGLEIGHYEAEIIFISNDPFNTNPVIDVTLDVTDAPDIYVSWQFQDENEPDLVDWNDYYEELFNGHDYRVPIMVRNIGGIQLSINDIVAESEDFYAEPTSFNLQPDEEMEVDLIFNAPQPEEYLSEIVIHSDDTDEGELTLQLHVIAEPPPEINVEHLEITDNLMIGGEAIHIINIANRGESELRWWSNINVMSEPNRDLNSRVLRQSNSFGIPSRDDTGDQITSFSWGRSGTNIHKAGIAWDGNNDWMWLTSFNNDYIGAVDPQADFEEVIAWQPDGQHPMGAAWLEGEIYLVNWARDWLGHWDTEGNNLGSFNPPVRPVAVSSSGEYLMTMADEGDRDIVVLKPDGTVINVIDNYKQFISGDTRSFQWVDLHPDGQLWINTPGHIWQIEVDEKWNAVQLVQDFAWDGNQEWDGIGHDGDNLWLGGWNQSEYLIFDDGLEELHWLSIISSRGILDPDDNEDIALYLKATGLIPGTYEAELHIQSNDPDSPDMTVDVTLN
ncbi:MAG: hypothetical protein HQ568_03485, partial [Calditrichaeota bacterium]|nr:hypothetical protein [Calditrichota bacterium]